MGRGTDEYLILGASGHFADRLDLAGQWLALAMKKNG
jgi:hypothetical protein